MKLLKLFSPLIFGTWILRNTNNMSIINNFSYINIQDTTIKIKSFKQDGFFAVKRSKTAHIKNINKIKNNRYKITLECSRQNIYSYSFLGIEIPEYRSKSIEYFKELNLTLHYFDKTLLLYEDNNEHYYVFDLILGTLKYPHIETNITTFIFTQLFGILIGSILTHILLN